MRQTNGKEQAVEDKFLRLTAVQIVCCFAAFGAVFWAMKANTELFESFREEFLYLNENDIDPGSYNLFEFEKIKEDGTGPRSAEDKNGEAPETDDAEPEPESEVAEDETGEGASEEKETGEEEVSVVSTYSGAVMPVNGTVTSYYGERTHPVYGGKSFHSGQDIAAPEGTPVLAFLDGTVTEVGVGEKSGRFVRIEHDGGLETLYCHLKDSNVQTGVNVRGGDVIGFVGQTGLATGPHLHFEVKINGKKCDPRLLLEGAAVVS